MAEVSGLAVVLAHDVYECLELQYPRLRLIEAGYTVKVAGPEKGGRYASKEGYPVEADAAYGEIDPKQVAILVVPGGYAPDKMRRDRDCLKLVKESFDNGCVLGFICHGGWVPISAQVVNGKRVTSTSAIKDDLTNAGAEWVDEPCVVDGRMVTAQVPKDLPAFMKEILALAQSN